MLNLALGSVPIESSEVRSYCRNMPAIFKRAENSEVWDEHGVRSIFFAAACAVNYGHNNPR